MKKLILVAMLVLLWCGGARGYSCSGISLYSGGNPYGAVLKAVKVGDITRAIKYVNSSGLVVKVEIFYDSSVSDYADSSQIGSIAWALDQMPGGGDVRISDGVYPLTLTLDIDTSNTSVSGSGIDSVVLSKTTDSVEVKGILVDGATTVVNVSLSNLTYDGNRASHSGTRSYSHGIDVKDADFVSIDTVKVIESGDATSTHGSGGSGVSTSAEAGEVWIKNCILDDNEDRQIQAGNNNVYIINNKTLTSFDRGISLNMEEDDTTKSTVQYGIVDGNIVSGSDDGSCIGVYGDSKDIVISNNSVYDAPTNKFGIGIRTFDVSAERRLVITGNTINNCWGGVGDAVGADTPTDTGTATSATAATIVDNTKSWAVDQYNNIYIVCIDSGTGSGQCRKVTDTAANTLTISGDEDWSVTPSTDSVYQVWPIQNIGLSISNNVINATEYGVALISIPANITGNVINIQSGGAYGIRLNNTSAVVSGNDINTIGDRAINTEYLYNSIISNNKVTNLTSTPTVQGISVYGGRGVSITGNVGTNWANFISINDRESTAYPSKNIVVSSNVGIANTSDFRFLDSNSILISNNLTDDFDAVVTTGLTSSLFISNFNMDSETLVNGNGQTIRVFGLTLFDTSSSTSGGGTLGDGLYIGQKKIMRMANYDQWWVVTVTNHVTSSPEVMRFDSQDDFIELIWNGSVWSTVVDYGVTYP